MNYATALNIEQIRLTTTAIPNSHQLDASHMHRLRFRENWNTGTIEQGHVAYKCLAAEIITKTPYLTNSVMLKRPSDILDKHLT